MQELERRRGEKEKTGGKRKPYMFDGGLGERRGGRNQPPECGIPVQSCWRTGIVRAKRGPRLIGMVQSKAMRGWQQWQESVHQRFLRLR